VLPNESDAVLIEKLRAAGESYRQSHRAHECRDLRFVTDFPNHGEASRNVFNAIVEEVGRARQEVVVESPYFVIKSGGYAVLEDLHTRAWGRAAKSASTDASTPWRALSRLTGQDRHALRYGGKPLPDEHRSGGSAVGRAFEARRD
jgi:hypothetical protein